MRSNALRCIANTHREEGSDTPSGGWTINRNDPGNWTLGKVGKGELKGTKWGIAANTYPHLDIKNLTRQQADEIYIRDYWPKAWGDDWPMGFDQITYDATVNSGPGRGPLWTCRALGLPDARSKAAAVSKARNLSINEKVAAIKRAVSGQRMTFLQGLGTWKHFGKGWSGRCARMEALGVKMVLEEAGTTKHETTKQLEKESGAAKSTSNKAGAGAAGGATAGGGGATKSAMPSDAIDWIIAGGVTLAIVGTVGACIWIWWKHRERAKAYLDVAKGYYDSARDMIGA